MKMKMKNVMKLIIAAGLGLFSLQAQAIILTPADCVSPTCWMTDVNSNLTAVEVSNIVGVTGLTEYYKQDVGGPESGAFASSYETSFGVDPLDPDWALIEYVAGAAVSCPECFLLIKDGNQSPAQYIFDIGIWNGTDDLSMTGFWPNRGAISHVTIYGKEASVPEPAMVGLLAIGLLGMVAVRRKLKV